MNKASCIFLYSFIFLWLWLWLTSSKKSQLKKVVREMPVADGGVSSSDPWAWRKYGQKPIKGSPYPRYVPTFDPAAFPLSTWYHALYRHHPFVPVDHATLNSA
jgi:hypothetical protein